MGKFNSGWLNGKDDDSDEIKRKLRIRNLEQIRQNALGRKRDLRSKDANIGKPKSSFMKTLNQFASQRRKIEEATQITSKLLNDKTDIIKQEVIRPIDIRGFFRAGVKSREVHRPDPELEKFRNAVLQSDALQILQSGHACHRSEEKQQPSKSTKSPIEDDHADLKMEVAKILNNFNSSESSHSFDLDHPGIIEFSSSPVIGRCKGVKKKISKVKALVNETHKNLHSQENDISLVNNINKGERYRRRLFDEVTAGVNNRCKEISNNVPCNNKASRNSTPENVIFYSEMISKEPVNKIKKHPLIEPSDPDVIKYYVQICKFMGKSELKNMFRNKYKDPEESARESLKLTYKKVLKDYVQRQNCQSKSGHQTTPSSNSEILLEPDSDIARRVKKNMAFVKYNESTSTPTNSTDSTRNFVNKVNARSLANTVENNVMKRKHVLSSKGSEPEIPSTTQAIADPKSVRADLKMNSIHPDRQELVARFLEDQKCFTSESSQQQEERLVCKEKLYIDSKSKGAYYVQKNTKYVPAILRKNRSLADCVAKEKATILSYEKYPSQRNKSLLIDLNLENAESERTPNTINEPLLEAPKSKYNHMNAKYNQLSRLNIPITRDNGHQRNPVPERHSQRCSSSNNIQKNFILSQPYNLSPIKQHQNYSQDTTDSHDFRICQLSQETKSSDNGNCINRMTSFGDIQDRTNRLTIYSQNQKCSQENMDHAYASQHTQPSYHYQACELPSNCNLYQKQPHVSFVEPSYDRSNCDCSTALCCVDQPAYIPQNEYQVIPKSDYQAITKNDYQVMPNNVYQVIPKSDYHVIPKNEYQEIPKSEYSYHESVNSCSCCHQQNSMETIKNCSIPTRQPIKYLAVDGNRRQPIYNPNESCSFVRKQPCYTASRGESSDFEYHNMLKMNCGGGGDRPQSFAPPNGNQRYIVQRQIPTSPVFSQLAYRHNHRNANEVCKINDAYLHQMNRQMHSKRQ